MDMIDLETTPLGRLVSHSCLLETKILTPRKYEKLSNRRWRKKAAAKRLEQDLLARAFLPAVKEEIRRRTEEPISNIGEISDTRLYELRAQAEPYLLDHMGQVRAMMSTLGTFDGDRALEANDRARCWIRQIDRELRSRRHAQAA